MVGVIDEPLAASKNDTLDISQHSKALTNFIKTSNTPITIGIQGEWGSGKTSLLNTIEENLNGISEIKQIWINAWENSLLASPEEALLKIINEIIDEMLSADSNKERKDKILSSASAVFKGALRVGAQAALGSKAGELADELLASNNNSIKNLRSNLETLVNEIRTRDTNPYKKIVIYVDDLDRVDPNDAVKILELLKNIFSLPGCIFVLAIDYQVVVKGLEHKFGKQTADNEWEFRAFFDKIIQLPFMMPMGQYNIGKYVNALLQEIGFSSGTGLNVDQLDLITSYTIGGNPRALKRLVNSLSLITLFLDSSEDKDALINNKDKKTLLFALVCLQIAYPEIYNLLSENTAFDMWDSSLSYEVTKLKEEEDKEKFDKDFDVYKETDEFDEDWEECLFRICYLKKLYYRRVLDISRFLNYIKSDVLKSYTEDMANVISEVIAETSVTSVNTTVETQVKTVKTISKGEMKIVVDDKVFEGKTIKELTLKSLSYIVDNGLVDKIEFPWGVTSKRILISTDENPTHPTGRAFLQPLKYKQYTVETNVSRQAGLKNINKLCTAVGISYEYIEVDV